MSFNREKMAKPFEIYKDEPIPFLGDQSILFSPEKTINHLNANEIFEKTFLPLLEAREWVKASRIVAIGLHPLYWPERNPYNIISIILLSADKVSSEEEADAYGELAWVAIHLLDDLIEYDTFSIKRVEESLAGGDFSYTQDYGASMFAVDTIREIQEIFGEKRHYFDKMEQIAEKLKI